MYCCLMLNIQVKVFTLENRIMKKSVLFVCASLLFSLFVSCSSIPKDEKPLWADSYTVEQIFPHKEYVTGLAHASNEELARTLAEANLAAYFTREINSVTKAHQAFANTGENRESIDREITIKSQITLAGVQHTQSWRSFGDKQYYDCAYLNRKEAFSNYESTIISAQKRFYSFYNSALNEKDPFKKIALFNESKIAGQDYSDVLDFSLILYKSGYEKYEKDISVIAGIDEKISKAKLNISINVTTNNVGKPYKALIEKIISDAGYSHKKTEFSYSVIVTILADKTVFTDTILVEPAVSIEVRNNNESILSFYKKAEQISGFKDAEKFVDMKVHKTITDIIEQDFKLEICR